MYSSRLPIRWPNSWIGAVDTAAIWDGTAGSGTNQFDALRAGQTQTPEWTVTAFAPEEPRFGRNWMGMVRCPFVIRNFPFHAPLMFALHVAIADGSSEAAVASLL